MTAASLPAWAREFGIAERPSIGIFATKDDLDAEGSALPHSHVLRRAFNLLKLDAVLCDPAAPLIYFRKVGRIGVSEVLDLHKRFWNHGAAPILVIIGPDQVQVHSGLVRPAEPTEHRGDPPSLIESIERASSALKGLLPSVCSHEYFRRHARWFKRGDRVDRALLDNLQATRERLSGIGIRKPMSELLDTLLCRLVFTSYLFDRNVIGASYLQNLNLNGVSHLRDLLALRPLSDAKDALYSLFRQLAVDFNGDLFSDDLEAEANLISVKHVKVLEAFFHGTDVPSGQTSFWPYDFGVIPIETISAIYERFLKQSAEVTGAFYTPRFLAETVLDLALGDQPTLLGRRYLDPACGSGIFLVGLFNRMAEEWRRANPHARNDRRARELMDMLQSSIFGVDVNPTACRITAFSLYLAYLDQLSPRGIQELQAKGRVLPCLVSHAAVGDGEATAGNIAQGDFFNEDARYPMSADLVIGNPPWGSLATSGSPAARWCERHGRKIPDKQIAAAFMWKAAEHVSQSGRVCFVLPHGVLFNHGQKALDFQKAFLSRHALDRVLNLTDYQKFLFEGAKHPALIMSYRRSAPAKNHSAEYWVPKADWKAAKTEAIEISEHDRSILTIESILNDLDGEDAPQIWKRMAWASTRDRRLLDQLSGMPRLRDRVRQARDRTGTKPWLIAEGFQPPGMSDDPDRAVLLELPSPWFVEATSGELQLFLLQNECTRLRTNKIRVRHRSNKIIDQYRAPHVLVSQGFGSIAYVDFDVSFQAALRGINGPPSDRALLMFLAAYMRSALAQYFLFHTSSNWGVSRQKVHLEELLRLPFPTPETLSNPRRAKQIVDDVSRFVLSAARDSQAPLSDRRALADAAQARIEPLIFEYFDILPTEQVLVQDAVRVTIPSFRPNPNHQSVPAIENSSTDARCRYTQRLCATLNGWARRRASRVVGSVTASAALGIGYVLLEMTDARSSEPTPIADGDLLTSLDALRQAASLKMNTFELVRGVKVFHGNRLYIVKPLSLRHWTETVALNDADEVAASILMHGSGETA